MDYDNYLNLDKILNAQTPKTTEPLEIMFIVAHQSSELWFKVLIQELIRLIEVPKDKHPNIANKPVVLSGYGPDYNPTIQLQRIVKIFEHLTSLWDIIATITPDEYEKFRDKLGTASGKQSIQYRKVEELLIKLIKRWNYKYKHQLIDIETIFKKWQFSHMKTVERIIGDKPGTGGTTGVDYLRRKVDSPLRENHQWKGW